VVLSSAGKPERRGRSGVVIVVVGVLAVAGAAFWYLNRETPAAAPPAPAARPRATPATTAAPSAPARGGTGTVAITTGTEGATVFVDGTRLGPAPRRAELSAGSHRVRVEKEGFETFEREVHVVPGYTLDLEATLQTVAPRLSVTADVPGAQVFLDRKFVGQTPLRIPDVEPGRHRLNVSAEGYDGYSEDIQVVAGTNEITVRFKEVHLDESLAVKHRHGVGSCEGRLMASTSGLRYQTDHDKDSFSIAFASLEPLEVDYLKKNLRVKVRGGRTYNFTAEDADDLLVFQREVEAARDRLP
jgi:hypothetical protein